jgi:hypothetical protein
MKPKKQISMDFPFEDRLASYVVWGNFSSAVVFDGETYSLRVLIDSSSSWNGNKHFGYDYFECDKDGIITKCPRGLTKQYKGVKISNITDLLEEYKNKHVNE